MVVTLGENVTGESSTPRETVAADNCHLTDADAWDQTKSETQRRQFTMVMRPGHATRPPPIPPAPFGRGAGSEGIGGNGQSASSGAVAPVQVADCVSRVIRAIRGEKSRLFKRHATRSTCQELRMFGTHSST